jgi:hypothetical protein
MEEKIEITNKMRELKLGKSTQFPLANVSSVRNTVSLLNLTEYSKGHVWRSKTFKKEGFIKVTRIS